MRAQAARRLGRRGAALVVLALVLASSGVSLISPVSPLEPPPPSYTYLADLLPLTTWGWVFVSVAVLTLGQAAARGHDRPGVFAMLGALAATWAVGLIAGGISTASVPGIVAGTVWLGITALVAIVAGWPNPIEEPLPCDHPTEEPHP